MRDRNHREPAESLTRPGRLRPSWRRRLARLAVIAGLCALIFERRPGLCAALLERRSGIAIFDREPDCASAARAGAWGTAVHVCQIELQRTQDPKTGLRLADALVETGNLPAAKQAATQLLTTPAQAAALQILGQIARDEGELENAVTLLERARTLHRAEKDSLELARDDGLLASVLLGRSEFAEALRLLDECITEAHLSDDKPMQCHCHLVAAQTLIRVGYFSAAEHELALAAPLATSDDERIDLAYQRGNQAQEVGQHELAIVRFQDALLRSKGSRDNEWTINTELNLAYSRAELGQIDAALQHLEIARRLDADRKKELDRAWTAAQIAYRQHELTLATSLIELYFELRGGDTDDSRKHAGDPFDRDTTVDVAMLRARIELDRNNLEMAADWARRATDQAESIRGAQSALELRPWVLAKRRVAYELRFTALARNHQALDAAMVFDEWQGRTVQDALATSPPLASLDRRSIADHVTRLGNWLPVASPATFARSADREAVLRTMGDIDLLALIVANGDVWRLTANHGPPQLSRLGSLAEITDLIASFSRPIDAQRASTLGELLVPNDVFRETSDVLHVILDGKLGGSSSGQPPFGGLPVAALRHGATSLFALRPTVHLLRLPEVRCVPAVRSGTATVLADDKLPYARTEAEQVSALLHDALLHTTTRIGGAATKDALSAAKGDAVLHIAAHNKVGIDGAAVVLAGKDVSAPEIAALRLAPSLTVLSTCDAATSTDSELAGSLVAGFLATGSQHVLATLRPVSDAGAPEVTTRFYREGGATDPARALAAAQRALSTTTSNIDWPYFAVFGPDVCPQDTPNN